MNINFTLHKVLSVLVGLMTVVLVVASFYKAQDGDSIGQQSVLKLSRDSLLAMDTTIKTPWLRTLNPMVKDTTGDLVWNNQKQTGVIRLESLPSLKTWQQYHLWIYDLERPQADPVSAGEFSVRQPDKKQEWYGQVTPEELIKKPFKFLITLENTGDSTFNDSQSLLLAQP